MNLLFLFALLSSLYTALDSFFGFPKPWKIPILSIAIIIPLFRVISDTIHFLFISRKGKWKRMKKGFLDLFLGEYANVMQDRLKLSGGAIYCNPFKNETSRCTHNYYINGSALCHFENENNLCRSEWKNWTRVVLPSCFNSKNEEILFNSICNSLRGWDEVERIVKIKRLNKIIKEVRGSNKIYTLGDIFEILKLKETGSSQFVLNKDKSFVLKILIQLNCAFGWYSCPFEAEMEYEEIDVNIKSEGVGYIRFDFGYKSVNRLRFEKEVDGDVLQHFMDIMDEVVKNKRKCCFVSEAEPVDKVTVFGERYSNGHCLSFFELVDHLYKGSRFQIKESKFKEINFEGEEDGVMVFKKLLNLFGENFMDLFVKIQEKYSSSIDKEDGKKMFKRQSEVSLLIGKAIKNKGEIKSYQGRRFYNDVSWCMVKSGFHPLSGVDTTLNPKLWTQRLFKQYAGAITPPEGYERPGVMNFPSGIKKSDSKEVKSLLKEEKKRLVDLITEEKSKEARNRALLDESGFKLSRRQRAEAHKEQKKNRAKQMTEAEKKSAKAQPRGSEHKPESLPVFRLSNEEILVEGKTFNDRIKILQALANKAPVDVDKDKAMQLRFEHLSSIIPQGDKENRDKNRKQRKGCGEETPRCKDPRRGGDPIGDDPPDEIKKEKRLRKFSKNQKSFNEKVEVLLSGNKKFNGLKNKRNSLEKLIKFLEGSTAKLEEEWEIEKGKISLLGKKRLEGISEEIVYRSYKDALVSGARKRVKEWKEVKYRCSWEIDLRKLVDEFKKNNGLTIRNKNRALEEGITSNIKIMDKIKERNKRRIIKSKNKIKKIDIEIEETIEEVKRSLNEYSPNKGGVKRKEGGDLNSMRSIKIPNNLKSEGTPFNNSMMVAVERIKNEKYKNKFGEKVSYYNYEFEINGKRVEGKLKPSYPGIVRPSTLILKKPYLKYIEYI